MVTIQPMQALAVVIGGGLGSLLRLWVSSWTFRFFGAIGIPWGTLSVNVIGGLLIGILSAWFIHKESSLALQSLLVTGFLGGFTTFSTFSLEVVTLFRRQEHMLALAYSLASVILCVLAAAVGFLLMRMLVRI